MKVFWSQLPPLVMALSVFGFFFIVNILLSTKKGQGVGTTILLSLIPFAAFFVTVWLLCLPNEDVASTLRSMKKKLGMRP
jgi:hypothetical protein